MNVVAIEQDATFPDNETIVVEGIQGPVSVGGGGMDAAVYDPQSIEGDAFDLALHTGEVPLASVTGLTTALGGKVGTDDSRLTDTRDPTPLKINPATLTLVDGATVTIACDASKAEQNAKVTLAGNRALAWTGIADGMRGELLVIQDATGTRTLTPSAPVGFTIKKRSGALALSTAAAAHDVISWKVLGTVIVMTIGDFA